MKVPICSICEQPVLELRGQYEVLQAYYAESELEHPALKIAGSCHFPCLNASEYAPKWYEWQIHHFSVTRGYESLGEVDGWMAFRPPRLRELFAIHVDGTTIDASPGSGGAAAVRCDDGLCLPNDEEYNLELDNEESIRSIQDTLQREGKYSITELYRVLDLEDKIRWPHALEHGVFRLDKKLSRHWGRYAVSMRATYHSFLPEPLIPFWKQLGG